MGKRPGQRKPSNKPKKRKAAAEPVSVIVAMRAPLGRARACLASLASTTKTPLQILLVHSGTAFPAEAAACADEFGATLLTAAEPRTFAQSVNAGLSSAEHDRIVIMHDDVVVRDGWLAPLLKAVADPSVGIAGGLLLAPDGAIQQAGMSFEPSAPAGFAPRFAGLGKTYFGALQQCRVPAVSFALAMLKLETVAAVGLLDESLRASMEDVDYCLRAASLGYRSVYCPGSCAHHDGAVISAEHLSALPHERLRAHLDDLDAVFGGWADRPQAHALPELAGFGDFCDGWRSLDSLALATTVGRR